MCFIQSLVNWPHTRIHRFDMLLYNDMFIFSSRMKSLNRSETDIENYINLWLSVVGIDFKSQSYIFCLLLHIERLSRINHPQNMIAVEFWSTSSMIQTNVNINADMMFFSVLHSIDFIKCSLNMDEGPMPHGVCPSSQRQIIIVILHRLRDTNMHFPY